MAPMSFQIDHDLSFRLKAIAKELDISPSALIREIVTAHLEERPVSVDKIQGQYIPRPRGS